MELAQKIQKELDVVKCILAQNNVTLDMVELRLETRGFIDKLIGFEINKTKILDLLIGDHLYGNQDVAIRELVQNSIDICKLKEIVEPGFTGKIILKKESNGTLVIEDNGFGMDYYEAKLFLSNIGTSFYNSDLFKERLAGKDYSPISQYGIGILSCFLICNKVTIETLKDNHEACKFSVESVYEEWKYEKGHRTNPGTKITLTLNEYGQSIKLKDSLQKYFLNPNINIEYHDVNKERQNFEPVWEAGEIYRRFGNDSEVSQIAKIDEILKCDCADYNLIFGTNPGVFDKNLILFNHGIYIGKFRINGLTRSYFVCVNLNANLVDLTISREDVKQNSKWSNFIYSIFNDIFKTMADRLYNGNKLKIIDENSMMFNSHELLSLDSMAELLENYPFIKSFFENSYFIIVDNGKVEFIECSHALRSKELTIYNCCSRSLSDELNLLSSIPIGNTLLVNPYKMTSVKNKRGEKLPFLEFILNDQGIRHTEIDLRQILIDNSQALDIHYPELLPDNVKLATFNYNLKPLFVVYEHPVVKKQNYAFGTAYWGNILLWQQLIDKERRSSYLNSFKKFRDKGDVWDALKKLSYSSKSR